MAQPLALRLPEWTTATPQTHPSLAGLSFDDNSDARLTAQQLTKNGRLIVHELAGGLHIETRSMVGGIRLGRLSLTIVPKIESLPLMTLLRFAYGLRNLYLLDARISVRQGLAFQDLLILQLIYEVQELLSRGLLRRYRQQHENLASPAGRIDFLEYTRQGGTVGAALPCIYHDRLENCLHNQVLLAGLTHAAHIAVDLSLRSRARRLAALLSTTIQPVPLNAHVLAQVDRQSDRLTEAYRPALQLIRLLLGETGMDLEDARDGLHLSGFLFDMNRFFQALVSRLLHTCLEGFEVQEEHRLHNLLTYVPGYRLPGHQDPVPRPDFAIFQRGRLVSLCDTKYRDLWQNGLPRDMLYQLFLYALSRPHHPTATILYPTLDHTAREARLQINEPVQDMAAGQIVMRPVHLIQLEKLLTANDQDGLKTFTRQLIFAQSA